MVGQRQTDRHAIGDFIYIDICNIQYIYIYVLYIGRLVVLCSRLFIIKNFIILHIILF
jgi:hypothetical protein